MNTLNEQQLEAVKNTEGYVRVVAGPGSGKTRTIAHRFAYLVNDLGITSKSILALTFTNKAAKEMKQRIEALIGEPVGDNVCTFHSFGKTFLREEIFRLNLPQNFDILDESDCLDLLKEIYDELKIPTTGPKGIRYKDALSKIRDGKKRVYPNYMEYFNDKNRKCPPDWDRLFVAYIVKQRKYNKLDFSDLIHIPLYILNNYHETLVKWSKRIVYVLVDETQDNNDGQWQLSLKLSEINGNLFMVGDPDQSIYMWRGARPQFFVGIESILPSVKTITMEKNYRSYQAILTASNNVIKNNTCRIDKTMIANRDGDTIVRWHHAESEVEEAKWIVNRIKELKQNGTPYNDIAVLYRSSFTSRYIEEALIRSKIPYLIYGGVRFFEREEIKDVLAYMKLIEFDDDMSFLRIINKPRRGLGPSFIDTVKRIASDNDTTLFRALSENLSIKQLDRDGAHKFCKFIKDCRQLKLEFSISDVTEYIIDESGLRQTLTNNGDEERMENLKELVGAIKFYEEEHSDSDISFETYLQDMALLTNMDYRKEKDSLRIMTIHQSKGLEFKNVFVCNLTEGGLPSTKSLNDGLLGLEEERRVMYVAMTRAKDNLFLSDSEGFSRVTGDSKSPSRFIYESRIFKMTADSVPVTSKEAKWRNKLINRINRAAPTLCENDKVYHVMFGWGTIIGFSDDGQSYQIEFEHSGFKLIKIGTAFERTMPANSCN